MRFFIAWADSTETTFGPEHEIEDFSVYAFTLRQQEGGFATLDVDVINPHTGLLAPGRQKWAWFAVDLENTDGPIPLFFGRLVAVPENINGEQVKLSFQARPGNYDARKRTAAAALRVAPYYDALWLNADRRDDPDAVLEFYPKVWHCDRVTHAVTASDIITGEGSSTDFADNILYDSLSMSVGSPPLRAVKVEGQVTWDQTAKGAVDLSQSLKDAFETAGSGNGWTITSLTGGGLSEDWPKKGDNIGSGWEVGVSSVRRVDNLTVVQDFVTVIATNETGTVPVWTMAPVFNANYSVTRQRSEKIRFTIYADCQAVVTEPADDEVVFLTVASSDTDQPIDAGSLKPVRDVRRRAYFPTARGHQSFTALIAMARAQLLARARAVEVSFDVPFLNALELDCTMNASVTDPRLPGGEAAGKIVAYQLSLSGDDMHLGASITIGCTVGKGNTVTAEDGDPDYVEDDYAEEGWQVHLNQFVMPIAGQVRYLNYSGTVPVDDGVNFFAMTPANVIDSLVVSNGETAQRAVLDDIHADLVEATQALNEVFTEVDLTMVPLDGGPFETTYNVTVSQLMVPRLINLEAA